MRRILLAGGAFVCLFLIANFAGAAEPVPSPEKHLGRPVGTDFQLANWSTVRDYYHKLAAASDNVELQVVGQTTEHREFCIAVISSKENLQNLAQIRRWSKTLADPRGHSPEEIDEAVNSGKVILFITLSMHSDEPAATEMGMQLAYDLATGEADVWKQMRQSAVVVIVPSLNPDGVDHVSGWYQKHVNTPLEGTSLPHLYQYYTGHDNNRDFFALTQHESRMLSGLLYHEWFPQILWDVHQYGGQRERFFVPPYRDPLNPNIPPAIVAGTNVIGTRAMLDLTKEGLTGVASGVAYDNWWNGGNRSVPCRHNMIGILTEAASANLASPRFVKASELTDPLGRGTYSPSNQFVSPWPGGWWRLSSIVKYELAFARSLFGSISREPKFWLRNSVDCAQQVIAQGQQGGPRGWLITTENQDLGAVRRLVDILLLSGVEVRVATQAFVADERQYEPGTIVLMRDQPYGNFIKDLFELQNFPKGEKPYDVTGWSLPLLLGVRRVQVERNVDILTRVVQSIDDATSQFPGDPRLARLPPKTISIADSRSWGEVSKAVQGGRKRHLVLSGPQAGLWFPDEQQPTGEKPENVFHLTQLPRIGIYSPPSPRADEGWMRWMFDDNQVPFRSIHNESLRAGRIRDMVDVLIIPDFSSKILNEGRRDIEPALQGGLETEGIIAIQEFVRGGGKLITTGDSSNWAITQFQLPVVDVTRGAAAEGFSGTGSLVRSVSESSPLFAGAPPTMALFFADSAAYRDMTAEEKKGKNIAAVAVKPLLKYSTAPVLLSGHIARPELIENQAAWVEATVGNGSIHLFGFRPHYRGWSQGTFHLLLRAALLSPSP